MFSFKIKIKALFKIFKKIQFLKIISFQTLDRITKFKKKIGNHLIESSLLFLFLFGGFK